MASSSSSSSFLWVVISFVVLLFGNVADGAAANADVKKFPGFDGPLPSKHYAGYISIGNADIRKHLYYYFATSEKNPSEDPVTLFINGGPGCSGLSGIVHHTGPFEIETNADFMTAGTKVKLNEYRWTKITSLLFVDSPAATPYSYFETGQDHSDMVSDWYKSILKVSNITPKECALNSGPKTSNSYVTDDSETVSDLYEFVIKWFSEFPEFLSNGFYLTGMSYSGVYVPALAQEIANGIEAGYEPRINFKGYTVGNGAIDVEIEINTRVPFAHRMGLISDEQYMDLTSSCGSKYWNNDDPDCLRNLEIFRQNLGSEAVDIEHVLCLPCHFEMGLQYPSHEHDSFKFYESLTEKPEGRRDCFDYDERVRRLFDLQSSRESLHARPVEVTGPWRRCPRYHAYKRDLSNLIPHHLNLTMKGYRAFIFNGDHDMVIPPLTSLEWMKRLNYSVIQSWRPWFVEDRIAGYMVQYDHNLLFATFKGAGHTVPEFMRREVFIAHQRWYSGSNSL